MTHPVTLDWVLSEVRLERIKQDKRWGEQNHPDGTGVAVLAGGQEMLDEIRLANERAVASNTLTWTHILLEELFEAITETDPDRLSEELIQVAAVAVAWREAIMRRTQGDYK